MKRPLPREGEVDLAELRQAQRRVGELLWLMSRSRPDLQYVVALMASRVSKKPKVVNQIGHRLLDYLCQTANYCLVFGGSEEPDDEVNVFTDSSFAPRCQESRRSCSDLQGNTNLLVVPDKRW